MINAHNEWDPLEEVLVGDVVGAVYPPYTPITAANGDPKWLASYAGLAVEDELVVEAVVQRARRPVGVGLDGVQRGGRLAQVPELDRVVVGAREHHVRLVRVVVEPSDPLAVCVGDGVCGLPCAHIQRQQPFIAPQSQ